MEESIRILVIDDEPQILESYRSILSSKPVPEVSTQGATLFEHKADDTPPDKSFFNLTLHKSGEDGVEAVNESIANDSPFALAFIDMKMPGIDGAETARQIWDIDPGIRIVFVTAYSKFGPEDINRHTGRDSGFYLNKPFNPSEIQQFVTALTKDWSMEQVYNRILFA